MQITSRTTFALTKGQTVIFELGGRGTATVLGLTGWQTYQVGTQEAFIGPFDRNVSIAVEVESPVSYRIDASGSDLKDQEPALIALGARLSVNVHDFGAVGDGTTDDAAAIQAAIIALPAYSRLTGLAGKTYLIGSAGLLISDKDDVVVEMRGSILKIGAVSSRVTPGFGSTAILMTSCVGSSILDCKIDGNSIATNAVGVYACTDCEISGNEIYASGLNGQIVAGGGGVRNRFSRNVVRNSFGSARGMWLGNVNSVDLESDIFVSENTVFSNGASGIVCSASGGVVVGNISKSNAGSGIVVSGANGYASSNLSINANRCNGNAFHGIQSDVVYSSAADLTQGISVSGNNCNSNLGAGIYAVNSRWWAVTGNTCNDNVSGGIQADDRTLDIAISGNTCVDTRAPGSKTQEYGVRRLLQVSGITASGATITGNNCSGNKTAGIRVTSVSSGYIISRTSVSSNECNDNGSWGIMATEATDGDVQSTVCNENVCYGNGTFDIRLSIQDVSINGNRYATQQDAQYRDLTGATPTVAGRSDFRLNNGSATSVTAFNGGVDGQTITLRGANGNTTINHTATILNNGATNVVVPTNGSIGYKRESGLWFERFRSF